MVFNSAFLLRFAMKLPRVPGKFSAIVLAPLDSFAYFLTPSFHPSHEDTRAQRRYMGFPPLSEREDEVAIVDAAYALRKSLGPGLLECDQKQHQMIDPLNTLRLRGMWLMIVSLPG